MPCAERSLAVGESMRQANPWRAVGALGVTQIIAWGSIYYAFSLLIQPLAKAVAASQSVVVGAFSAALLVAGLASSVVGMLIDHFGGRWVMAFGSLLGAALLAALSQVHAVYQLYLVWAGLGVVMAATLYDPAFAVLVQLFRERQRSAITAVTLFGGFASTVFWPLTQWLIERHGWQHALLLLALLQLVICAPLHALMLPSGAQSPVGKRAKGEEDRAALRSIVRQPSFYLLCMAFTGNALIFSAMSVHFIPLLADKGLTATQAAWVGATIGPMQVLGRLLEWRFMSHLSPSTVGVVAMWLLPASLVLLCPSGNLLWWLALFSVLYGLSNGVMTIVRGAIPAELYGHGQYGAVNGAMATPVLIAKAAGPFAAALAMQMFPHPSDMLWVLVAVGAVSAWLFGKAIGAMT